MRTETGIGFLVDPMGAAPIALDESEFQKIRDYLDIMRNEEASALKSEIQRFSALSCAKANTNLAGTPLIRIKRSFSR